MERLIPKHVPDFKVSFLREQKKNGGEETPHREMPSLVPKQGIHPSSASRTSFVRLFM